MEKALIAGLFQAFYSSSCSRFVTINLKLDYEDTKEWKEINLITIVN